MAESSSRLRHSPQSPRRCAFLTRNARKSRVSVYVGAILVAAESGTICRIQRLRHTQEEAFMRSPIRRARLWILALVPLLAPLYSCAGAGGGRAVNCDIVRLQRQEGLPPSQIATSFQVSEADIAKCPNASPAAEAAPPPSTP